MSVCVERGCRKLQTVCSDCGRVVCTKTIPMILSEDNISFLKYFLGKYKKSISEGLTNHANHDAAAIALYLEELFDNE